MTILKSLKKAGKKSFNSNKEAVNQALKVEAGKTVVELTLKGVKKQLPWYGKTIASHPMAEIVTSLALSLGIDFLTTVGEDNPLHVKNEKVQAGLGHLAEGLRLNTAMLSVGKLNITETICNLLDEVDFSGLMEEEESLEELTKPKLKAMCDSLEIEYKSTAKKEELIALIEKAKSE